MLMCSSCWTGWHMGCLQPPLKEIPAGDWFCPNCTQGGEAEQQLTERRQQHEMADARLWAERQSHPSAATKRRDEAAAALHGRVGMATSGADIRHFRLHYRGAAARPEYFTIMWQRARGPGEKTNEWENISMTKLQGRLQRQEMIFLTALPAGIRVPATPPEA